MFLILILAGCSGIITPTKILSANIIITDWNQTYYESWQEWSYYVYVYYEVESTGIQKLIITKFVLLLPVYMKVNIKRTG